MPICLECKINQPEPIVQLRRIKTNHIRKDILLFFMPEPIVQLRRIKTLLPQTFTVLSSRPEPIVQLRRIKTPSW